MQENRTGFWSRALRSQASTTQLEGCRLTGATVRASHILLQIECLGTIAPFSVPV
jgi:hypothetical protein